MATLTVDQPNAFASLYHHLGRNSSRSNNLYDSHIISFLQFSVNIFSLTIFYPNQSTVIIEVTCIQYLIQTYLYVSVYFHSVWWTILAVVSGFQYDLLTNR